MKNNGSKTFHDVQIGDFSHSRPLENPSESLNQSHLLLNSESNKQINGDAERYNLN